MLRILLCPLLNLFLLLIFVRIILSWFPATGGFLDQVNRFVMLTTEWAMGPLRRIIPPVRLGAAALDLSPIIVIIGISVVSGLINC